MPTKKKQILRIKGRITNKNLITGKTNFSIVQEIINLIFKLLKYVTVHLL